jgi:hypothetical protein
MSSISINDLAHSTTLDSRDLAAVRGGSGFASPEINVNVAVTQQLAQFQKIGVNVLNGNGVIGAGLGFGDHDLALAAEEWKANRAA